MIARLAERYPLAARLAAFWAKWTAAKFIFFAGVLVGMLAQSVLIALVLAGVELVP